MRPALRRELGVRDIVLFNIAAILGPRWIPIAAAAGYRSLFLWLLALIFFLIPQGYAAAELSTRYPEEGGIYVWSRKAFGPFHGFICGWCYWANNLTYLPSMLIGAAGISALIFGPQMASMADHSGYVGGVALLILWTALILNLVGLRTGKWLQNIGGAATWVPCALLVLFGALWLAKHDAMNSFSLPGLLPDWGDISTFSLWASLCFALAGLELPSTLSGEVRDPLRTFPRAILISSIVIVMIYLLATWAVLVLLPQNDIGIITGFIEAVEMGASRLGIAHMGIIVALLITVGNMGGAGAWLAGTARIPFAAGLDESLPPAFGRLHPRWGTPHIAILFQGLLATILLIGSFAGEKVKGAYLVLLDMTIIVYFIPYLYMFAALVVLGRGAGKGDRSLIPGGVWGRSLVAFSGLASTLAAIGLALVPPPDTESVALFELKVGGGALVFVGTGLALYLLRRLRRGSTSITNELS